MQMGKWSMLAAAFSDDSGVAPAVTGEIKDVLEDFVNMELFEKLCDSYARMFLVGFAATTLAVLVTFAVSKALSLVRID